MKPSRDAGAISTAGPGMLRPTFAYHSKSTSGHTVQASAGTAAVASATPATLAEISACILMFDPSETFRAFARVIGEGYEGSRRVTASACRDPRSAVADTRNPSFGRDAALLHEPRPLRLVVVDEARELRGVPPEGSAPRIIICCFTSGSPSALFASAE